MTLGKVSLIGVSVLLVSSVCRAQAPCVGDDSPIALVHVELSFPDGNPEGSLIGADFGEGPDGKRRRPPMEPDGSRWAYDIAKGRSLLGVDSIPLRELKNFTPYRVGWSYVPAGQPTVERLTTPDGSRCAASFGFEARPVWALRVAVPKSAGDPPTTSAGVPVNCPGRIACEAGSRTDLETRALSTSTPFKLEMDFGLCRYVVDVAPSSTLPLALTPRTLSSGCNGWQYFQFLFDRPGLKIPPRGIVIDVVK